MKFKASAKIPKILLEKCTKEEMEEFVKNEIIIAFVAFKAKQHREWEELILYGNSTVEVPVGVLNHLKKNKEG